MYEVTVALRSITVSKSAGPNNLSPKFIRDGAEKIMNIFYFLANQGLFSGSFPNIEKYAGLTPIHKYGEKTNFDNCRTICVLNDLPKVSGKLVHKQLSECIECNSLLSTSEFCFRQGRSTQNAVTFFTEHIRNNMEQSHCTGALFIDLRKALNTVHHATLLDKLAYYGIQNIELSCFEDYLFKINQFSLSQTEQIT